MENGRGKNSDPFFQPSGKYLFAAGSAVHNMEVSHENFVRGNAPCLSLKEKKKYVITLSGTD